MGMGLPGLAFDKLKQEIKAFDESFLSKKMDDSQAYWLSTKSYFICQMLNIISVFIFIFLSPTHLPRQMDALGHVLGNAKQIKHINNLKTVPNIYCYIINDNKRYISENKEKRMALEDRRKSK